MSFEKKSKGEHIREKPDKGSSFYKSKSELLEKETLPQEETVRKMLPRTVVKRQFFRSDAISRSCQADDNDAPVQTNDTEPEKRTEKKDPSFYGISGQEAAHVFAESGTFSQRSFRTSDSGFDKERHQTSGGEGNMHESSFFTSASAVWRTFFIAENRDGGQRIGGKADEAGDRTPEGENRASWGAHNPDTPPVFVQRTNNESGNRRGGSSASKTAFRTVDESCQKSRRFVRGTGRFTSSFVSKTDETQEEKEREIQQTPQVVAKYAYKSVMKFGKNAVDTVKNAMQLITILFSGGAVMLGGLMLPIAVFAFAGILLLVIVIAAVISAFLMFFYVIFAAFATELGGCDMYQYAYDYTERYIAELDALSAGEIRCYVDGVEADSEDVQEIEINYQEAYLVYLAFNDPATYINGLLELTENSEASELESLHETTEENKDAFEEAFSRLYYYEYDEEEDIAKIYFCSWDYWYDRHLLDYVDADTRITQYRYAFEYDEQKEMLGVGNVLPLEYEIKYIKSDEGESTYGNSI